MKKRKVNSRFLKDCLITEERQKQLDNETKQFGNELYESSVLNSLHSQLICQRQKTP